MAGIVTVMNGYELCAWHMAGALEKTTREVELAAERETNPVVAQNAKNRAVSYRREIEKIRTREEDPSMSERIADSVADVLRANGQKPDEKIQRVTLHVSLCTFLQVRPPEIERTLNLNAGWKVRVDRAAMHPTPTRLFVDEDLLIVSFGENKQDTATIWIAPENFNPTERYIYTLARAAGDSPAKAKASAREATRKKSPAARSKTAAPAKGAAY